MARAESSQSLQPGAPAPAFDLVDTVSGARVSLDALRLSRGVVVAFICNHCPYVLHILDGLVQLARDYEKRGIAFVAISSNDVQRYPADAPAFMRELARARGFGFPYLYDESQAVARAYGAACTPDFFVVAADGTLHYAGRFDDASPGNGRPVSGADLRGALDALLAGAPPLAVQVPSIGCSLKWKES